MQKTSYGNRSQQGADTQEILFSLIRTCSKQGINYLDLAAQQLTADCRAPELLLGTKDFYLMERVEFIRKLINLKYLTKMI